MDRYTKIGIEDGWIKPNDALLDEYMREHQHPSKLKEFFKRIYHIFRKLEK